VIRRDIIVIGGSAGGIEALKDIFAALPAHLPAAIFVTVHISPQAHSVLPDILARASGYRLAASQNVDGAPVRHGHLYVAPPDHHLVVHEGASRLTRGPKENGARPAVDPLFRSAARWYGPRVIGVILSGNLDDGAAGLLTIKRRGGLAIVQEPAEAAFPGMPESALAAAECDLVLSAHAIGPALAHAVSSPVPETDVAPIDGQLLHETEVADSAMNTTTPPIEGKPSTYGCPECGGALWELHEGDLVRFRCRVGHAFSPETLVAEQSHSIETALWSALRALEEAESLSARLARRMESRSPPMVARFDARAREARRSADVIRTLLTRGQIAAQEPAGHEHPGAPGRAPPHTPQ
jgi:two-component system chemotaxis response regulator CheB